MNAITTVVPKLQIKATCTQLGLAVDASQDSGKTWICVQLTRYRERSRPIGGKNVFRFIDPGLDRADYFKEITARGIEFKAVK